MSVPQPPMGMPQPPMGMPQPPMGMPQPPMGAPMQHQGLSEVDSLLVNSFAPVTNMEMPGNLLSSSQMASQLGSIANLGKLNGPYNPSTSTLSSMPPNNGNSFNLRNLAMLNGM
jgi:hypothetical protein